MISYLINLFIKTRYGVLRQLTITFSNTVGTGSYRIKTYIGWRWSGALTVNRLSIIHGWVSSGKLVKETFVNDGNITAITYSPGKVWTFMDILRFRSLIKPSNAKDKLAESLHEFYSS